MKRLNLIFIALLLLSVGVQQVEAQNNCECVLCRVPCNAPLSAHKNTKCPAYIAAHKQSNRPTTAPSGNSNNSIGALNNLIDAVSNSNNENSKSAPAFKAKEPEYDPMDEALKSTRTKVQKIEDPEAVDLSGLKNPYSAKVDITKLKEVESNKETDDPCKAAFEYKRKRMIALNNLINNRHNLVSQQEKSLNNAKTEFESWKKDRMKIIKEELSSYFKDLASEKLKSLSKPTETEAVNQVIADNSEFEAIELNESNTINFCNYFVAGLNKTSKMIDAIPALKAAVDKSPAKWLKKAVDDGPKLIDALALVYIQNEINDHNKDLLKENQRMNDLNAKIESWMNEKAELEACKDDDCNCIRAIIQKRRPDLRDSSTY